jgi:membrane protease YdiL (CAAX protease family)
LCEYGLLFVGLPLLFATRRVPLPLLPALWILAAVCLGFLLRSSGFDRSRLWNADRLGPRLRRALLPVAIAAPILFVLTWLIVPDHWFGLVRRRPGLWLAIMVLYPVLSAYPQGIVYRVFIHHRYRGLFGERGGVVLAGAIAFTMVHVIFMNPVAPLLTLVGGALFAWTYERTGSSLVATLQHAAFGCLLFTSGLGGFFYYGAVGG